MMSAQSLRLRRIAISAAIAGLGTFGFTGYHWWSYRGSVPQPDVSAAILILVAIGAAAGLLSGRLRDAPVAWVAAAIGWTLAYQANYIIDPAWPTSDSSFGGAVLLTAIFLLPLVGGGHLLGVWLGVASRTLQRGAGSRLGA
jgi:hypothetical protein